MWRLCSQCGDQAMPCHTPWSHTDHSLTDAASACMAKQSTHRLLMSSEVELVSAGWSVRPHDIDVVAAALS